MENGERSVPLAAVPVADPVFVIDADGVLVAVRRGTNEDVAVFVPVRVSSQRRCRGP
jgi:hypothetical protein